MAIGPGQVMVGGFLLAGAAKLVLYINLQMRLDDLIDWNQHPAAGSIFKKHFGLSNSDYATAKVSLAIHRRSGLDLCLAAGEPLVIGLSVKSTLEPGRRNLQRVSRMDEIVNIQHRAEMSAYVRAILVRDSAGLINKDPNRRVSFRADK